MKTDEVQNIRRLLANTFNGAAWHGPSVMKVVDDINYETAFKKFEKIHSIAELVEHMISWRKFCIERIKGNHQFEVVETEDWKSFSKTDEKTWVDIKTRLNKSQENLLQLLDKINDSKLSDLVDEKAFDYYTLLHGVIQHDIYHAGQMSLLKKK